MDASSKPRVLIVAGPTASGKSALALELAQRFGGEIVNADSLQWVRGFDIGTAKATAAERALVPHHVLDVLDPTEEADVAHYVRLARAAIADISARGKRPIVCGGTGLYIRALLGGLVPLPGRDETKRVEYQALIDGEGLGPLVQRLLALDPEAKTHVDLRNPPRVIRALEVIELTGRPLWQWQAEHCFAERPYRTLTLALMLEAAVLRERIAARTEAMLAAGFVDEVRGLLERYPDRSLKPYGSIGYREVLQMIDGALAPEDLAAAIAHSTFIYAKKQMTWLRAERDVAWLRADEVPQAAARVEAFLAE